jgi:hypothetical protein
MFSNEQWLANSGGDFYNGVATQSARFDSGSSAYLSKTPDTASNRKTWTMSMWVKRGILGTNNAISLLEAWNGASTDYFAVGFTANDDFRMYNLVSNSYTMHIASNATYRDPSSWYHIVVAVDTTQATSTNRAKVYINGEQVTSLSTTVYPSLNADMWVNNNILHKIARNDDYAGNFNGYLSDVNFIDGLALTPTSFGEFKNSAWIPINTSGLTFGTNGFRLKFDQVGVGTASTSTIGADTSGNTNHWTSSGIVASDCAMPDSPENNFCTMNPINKSTSMPHFSEGNLKLAPNAGNYNMAFSNMGVSSGKFYYEFGISGTTNTGDNHGIIDLSGIDYSNTNTTAVGTKGYAYYPNNGNKTGIGSTSSYGNSYTNGDIISVALDMDAGKVWFAKNGTYQASGNPATGANEAFSGLSGTYFTGATLYAGGFSAVIFNFGQDSSFAGTKTAQGNTDGNGIGDFYYAPPSGYLALCSANLPEPTIGANSDTQADDHFNTVLYTGNATARSITGLDFQPDLTWIKARSATTQHTLVDSIRGTGNWLESNATAAEQTGGAPDAFNSDGFDLTTWGQVNGSGVTFVSWNWKANGTGASNTDGSITSTVSANTDAGFSIVSYTGNTTAGATVGHGLAVAPDVVIVKWRTGGTTQGWPFYHSSVYPNDLKLNTTAAAGAGGNFNATTSSVISLTASSWVNSASMTYIAYCFHSVEGYSKIGSYTGNGSADGTFVYTGFRPAWVMIKRTDAVNNWMMSDSARDPYNVVTELLYADLSNAAYALAHLDFTSNGFKVRTTNSSWNHSGGTFIYMAFADSVGAFKYANAR